jgi:hypothetical protein
VVEEFERSVPGWTPLPLANPFVSTPGANHGLWLWPEATGGNGMFISAWRKD